jgi:hypothetical protein
VIQLPVPFHQQDLANFCGPATAQMILEPIIASLAGQGDLEATMAASTASERCKLGLTSPKQLEFGLNATQQSRGNSVRQFEAYCFQRQVDGTNATAAIVQTLRLGTAAAALIMCGGHWVAVTGAAMPADDPDGLQPEALYINNPWPPVPSAVSPALPPPPPHDPADGCGSGGNRGQAEHVALPGWYAAPYFTPVNMCRRTALVAPVYIVIGAAGLAATMKVSKGAGDSGHTVRARSKESSMVDHDGAVELVRRAIDRYGLVGPEFAEARFERPRIVKYLGVEDEAYYLVPLRWPDGSVLVGRVDAHRHTYLGAQLRPPAAIRTDGHYHLAEPREVREWIREDHIRFASHRAAEYGVRKELAWRPCVESRSPYYPFYQVTLGEETVGYIGLDHTPYSKLHDLLGG